MQFVQKFMMRKKSDTGARSLAALTSFERFPHSSADFHIPTAALVPAIRSLLLVCVVTAIFTPDLNKKCQEVIKML